MKIIIVSDCTKKALKESRKKLDAFGIRIAKKTWLVEITNEGLNNLIEILRKSARKNTALSFFNKAFDKIYFIGSSKKYCDDKIAIKIKDISIMNNKLINIKEFIKTICFLHDIGKANTIFQNKIRLNNVKEKDYIRHELLSLFIVDFIVNKHINEDNYNEVTNEDVTEYIIDKYLKKDICIIEKENDFNLKLMKSIILVHHKNINVSEDKLNSDFEDSLILNARFEYFNVKNKKEFKVNIVNDKTLFKIVVEKINYLMNIELINMDFEYIFTIGKYILMNSDYLSSSDHKFYNKFSLDKKEKYEKDENKLFAKSFELIRDQDDNLFYMNQTLLTHIKAVEKNSMYFLNLIFKETELNKMSDNLINELSKDEISTGRYKWQDYVLSKIEKRDVGEFIVVSSSTGSGKTKFVSKAMAKITNNKRFNVAMGLKNLTLQTKTAYEKQLKNKYLEKEISCLIGSDISRTIYDKNKDEDNYYDTEDDFIIDSKLIVDNRLNATVKTEKNKILLQSPILISTIDYLMRSIQEKKHLNAMLRVATSDLVLDEVDNYEVNDLLAISKLIYLTALFGNKVIISTATANNELVKFLLSQYVNGYKKYAKIYNKKDINFSFITDAKVNDNEYFYKKYNIDINEDYGKDLIDYFNELINDYVSKLENNTKHKVKYISLRDKSDFNSHIKNISDNNNEIDELGIKRSVGLCRVANTSSATNLYFYLLDKNKDNKDEIVIPILYHSQIPLIFRSMLEYNLDNDLNRSNNKKLKDTNIFKDIEGNEKYKGKKKITIVVIATPIEEVGRDHDFDWSIMEPSSLRQIIQTAGRVGRHRDIIPEYENIYILNENFRLLEYENNKVNSVLYKNPGLETSDNLFVSKNGGRDMLSIAKKLEEGLNQAYVVKADQDICMSIKEEKAIQKVFMKYSIFNKNKDNLLCITKNKYKENSKIGNIVNFRESNNSIELFILNFNDLDLNLKPFYLNEKYERCDYFNIEIRDDFIGIDNLFFNKEKVDKYLFKINGYKNYNIEYLFSKYNLVNMALYEEFEKLIVFRGHEYLGVFRESQLKKRDLIFN